MKHSTKKSAPKKGLLTTFHRTGRLTNHMQTTPLIRTLPLTCALGLSTIIAQADENTDAAVAAAKEWLSLIEAEEYVQSFQEAAPVFQEGMTAKKWKARMSSVRRAFGKTASRELIKARFTTSLPDAPD